MSAKLQYRILTAIAASVLIFTQFGSAQCASSSEVTSLHNLLSGLEANINIVVSELISSYTLHVNMHLIIAGYSEINCMPHIQVAQFMY